MSSFIPATREKTKLKLCLAGPSGSGKSYTALILAHAMLAAGLGKRIAVIESEAGKINKYAGYSVHGQKWDFAVCVLSNFGPQDYVSKLEEAHRVGFDIVIIDSISHEWQGKGGALETVDKTGGANKFTGGWKVVTPLHNTFIDTILRLPVHVIATCRLKMGYVLEESTNKEGKTTSVPKKIGLEPVQRNGMEYEFEIFASLDTSHILRVEKTICPMLDGVTSVCPGPDFFAPLFTWLNEGVEIKGSEYRSSLVPADKLAEVMGKLRDIGANIAQEKDFILKKFGVDEWSHLSPENFLKYTERVDLLVYSANQAAGKITGPTTSSASALEPAADTPTVAAPAKVDPASKPDEWNRLNDPAVQKANGDLQTLQEALTTNLPIHQRPIPDQAPASYGLTIQDRIRTLYDELRSAIGLSIAEASEYFSTAILPKFKAASAKDLSEANLKELEKALMTKLRQVYVETGREAALTF